MRSGFAVAALAITVAAPAGVLAQTSAPENRPKGYFGNFTIVVTEGEFIENPGDGNLITTDLAGRVFTLDWRTSYFYNVPSPGSYPSLDPRPILDRLVVNTVNFAGGVASFGVEGSDDPFEDYGSAESFADFSGSERGGTFGLGVDSNGAVDAGVYFTFARTGGRVAGSGRIGAYNEGSLERVNLRFDITGGRALAAVPEPATWALMISGFGLIGGAARRRRARVTVAFG